MATVVKKIANKRSKTTKEIDVQSRIKHKHIEVLEKLSTPLIGKDPHKDQFDRTIISQAIAEKLTVISADTVFPLYKDKGFRLLENI